MVVFIISVLDWKCRFGANLFQKIKIFKLSRILADRIKHAELNDNVHFSVFDRKYLFFGKFGPKNQNCLLKLKYFEPRLI